MDKDFSKAVNKEMGERIKRIREKQGKTQQYVADVLGTGDSYISRIENGSKGLTVSYAVKLAEALDVTVEDLVKDLKASDFD